MDSSVVRADPGSISTTLKEAVVDSLLNVVFSRISGHGPEGETLFGARPRAILSSAFLLPPLPLQGPGDEVTQPIRITAHGIDLQIFHQEEGVISVRPSFQVYVRILPSVDDLKRPDCAPRFRLQDAVRQTLRDQTDAELKVRWEIISAGKPFRERFRHPEWKQIDKSVRQEILSRLGLPSNITTLFSVEESGESDDSTEPAPEGVVVDGSAAAPSNDSLFRPMDVPHKWLRIPLDPELIPILVIDPKLSPAELSMRVDHATRELNEAIRIAVQRWAESDVGRAWCFRKNVNVLPSEYRGWQQFLDTIRSNTRLELALPDISLQWQIRLSRDWLNPLRSNLHVSLENASTEVRRGAEMTDQSVFQAHLEVSVPVCLHAPLKLGRVEASYRYNRYLEYPALGFNGGVIATRKASSPQLTLQTTWCPRYTQPRVVPKTYKDINPRVRLLSQSDGLSAILPLETALDAWFDSLDQRVDLAAGLSEDDDDSIARERAGFLRDKEGWRREISAVKAGLKILQDSADIWAQSRQRGHQSDERANVYEAWLAMNEAMADVLRDRLKNDNGEWRLFQIAFVIANIPAMASRMPSFMDRYDRTRDDTVTLLYFATGGGKSEAFFGLLVFSLFLDRLRGKRIGITAMVRYPLRLLTIQQAQRCAKVLARAEQVRRRLGIAGDPFSIGFWVGSGGSPNHHKAPGVSDIPDINDQAADVETERRLLDREVNYELQKAAWNKIPSCPFCGAETVLRTFSSRGGTLAHVCSNAGCDANSGGYAPLPFYICDTDIYDLAPSVLLGTVDKLALIGQSSRTLRRIYAMFGAAPWFNPVTNRLYIPNEPREFEGGPESRGYEGVFPAYPNGKHLFYDPFPSLIIQDEAHLLDESLGTFAGLFESALDTILEEIAKPLHEIVVFEPGGRVRRRAKVIAASATVSDPDRQLEHLYQRPVPAMQFPYPGEELYESFYAHPAEPDEPERGQIEDIEVRAKCARVYTGFMTNGRAHTATTVSILSNFHTVITEFLQSLTSGNEELIETVRSQLIDAISASQLAPYYRSALTKASASELATLIDLHRIALTYVTNKKGGDQIMAAEFEETRKRHAERKLVIKDLRTDLITGSVSQGDIQKTVQEAQSRPQPGKPLDDLDTALRSVIATSAVSHGVDVEEFNSMFFAGLPSDIAEYIQASSRVGRTHVGFVVLIPTPQRRRDRYVIEVFDSYHRFLERMVSPAAIDRWAGRAVERVLPSFIQAYLAGITYIRDVLIAIPDEKHRVRDLSWIPNIITQYNGHATRGPLIAGLCSFVEHAIGLDNDDFAPGGKQHYQELIRERVEAMLSGWARDILGESRGLWDFFNSQASVMKRPMTSLRDVDEAGYIFFGHRDLDGGRRIDDRAVRRVMGLIRRGVAEGSDQGD